MNSKFEGGNDQELIRHAQAGSLAAFEQLVYRYEKRIYAFVRVSCANGEDAQEITQDTFVRAFEAIARFDRAREFAPWLFTIARRKCIDRYRSAPPQTEELTLELHLVDNPAESVAGSEESSNLWEFARRLLPTVQFQAVWLNYSEDMSVGQIAHSLNRTQTHVKVLLFRARRALAGALERDRKAHAASARQAGAAESPIGGPRFKRLRSPTA